MELSCSWQRLSTKKLRGNTSVILLYEPKTTSVIDEYHIKHHDYKTNSSLFISRHCSFTASCPCYTVTSPPSPNNLSSLHSLCFPLKQEPSRRKNRRDSRAVSVPFSPHSLVSVVLIQFFQIRNGPRRIRNRLRGNHQEDCLRS